MITREFYIPSSLKTMDMLDGAGLHSVGWTSRARCNPFESGLSISPAAYIASLY